jgi:uncharacterized protein YjaZ
MNEHVRPGAPGKVGYYLGYRIVEEYVRRRGPDAWRELYDLPLAEILARSGVPLALPAGTAAGGA